jgi:hypothetical protein
MQSILYWEQEYNSVPKCKIAGIIENIKTTFPDSCNFKLKLEVHNNQNIYFANRDEGIYFKEYGFSCLGWQAEFPIIKFWDNWEQSLYYPEKWDQIYAIINKNNDYILKLWLDNYNSYSGISLCETKSIENNSMELWLTKEEITKIMTDKKSEFQILSSHQEENNQTWTDISSNISEINTWNTLEKNISVPKKEIIIPKKIVNTSSNKNVQIIKNEITNSETLSWTKIKKTESNSWITNFTWVSNKPFKTETWVAINQENNDLVYTSSNSWIYVILIILISVISFVFFKKKF